MTTSDANRSTCARWLNRYCNRLSTSFLSFRAPHETAACVCESFERPNIRLLDANRTDWSPVFSFLLSLSLSLSLMNIAVRCRYLHNPVDSISGLSRAERNRTELSTHGARTTTEDIARVVSIFCHPGVRASASANVRAADFIGAACHCCVYVDL